MIRYIGEMVTVLLSIALVLGFESFVLKTAGGLLSSPTVGPIERELGHRGAAAAQSSLLGRPTGMARIWAQGDTKLHEN